MLIKVRLDVAAGRYCLSRSYGESAHSRPLPEFSTSKLLVSERINQSHAAQRHEADMAQRAVPTLVASEHRAKVALR